MPALPKSCSGVFSGFATWCGQSVLLSHGLLNECMGAPGMGIKKLIPFGGEIHIPLLLNEKMVGMHMDMFCPRISKEVMERKAPGGQSGRWGCGYLVYHVCQRLARRKIQ